jgi:hypothetical protein
MLDLGDLVDPWPAAAAVPARLVSNLSHLLRSSVRQVASAAGGDAGSGPSGRSPAAAAAQAVASCCLCLARGDASMQLVLLNSVQLVEAACGMLGQRGLAPAGLELLRALTRSNPEAQLLLVEQPTLVRALVGLLQAAAAAQEHRQEQAAATAANGHAIQASQLFRALAQGSANVQLALARTPAVVVALARLLGSEEGGVANDVAETLAGLQRGGGEVEQLVREALRSVSLALG